jgi:hypothetical protein
MKPWKSNALLAAGSLAVAWVIAELVLAVFFPMETVFLEVDPELGWRHAPGRKGYWHRELTKPQYVETNSLGHRDRERSFEKPPGTHRILMLGDSFCEGYQVPLEALVHVRLEAMLRKHTPEKPVEVLNACVQGYGMAQEWLYLRREGARLAPDAVLLMLNLGNDFHDSFHGFTPSSKPSFDWEEAGLAYYPAKVSALRMMAINYGLTRSQVLRLVYRYGIKRSRWAFRVAGQMGLLSTVPNKPVSDENRLRMRHIGQAIVERMDGFCRERGMGFFVFMFPHGADVRVLARGERPMASFFEKEMAAFLEAREIPYTSAVGPFREKWEEGRAPYLLNGRGHWSEEGHKVAAEILFEHLKAREAFGEAEAPAASHQESGTSFQ